MWTRGKQETASYLCSDNMDRLVCTLVLSLSPRPQGNTKPFLILTWSKSLTARVHDNRTDYRSGCRYVVSYLTWSASNTQLLEGYIPYVDNFGTRRIANNSGSYSPFIAHLGGFVMALFVGTIFYPVISVTKKHRIIMTSARIAAIPVAVLLFVLLTRNFYTSDPYAGK